MTKAELEARAIKHANTVSDPEWDCFHKREMSYKMGFSDCAALLQVEMDALKEEIRIQTRLIQNPADVAQNEFYKQRIKEVSKIANKNAKACDLLAEEIDRQRDDLKSLTIQLQSANAKLAAARKALDKLAGPGDCGCMGRPCECLSETVLLIDRRERIGLAREALARIAAKDASEGKGKE